LDFHSFDVSFSVLVSQSGVRENEKKEDEEEEEKEAPKARISKSFGDIQPRVGAAVSAGRSVVGGAGSRGATPAQVVKALGLGAKQTKHFPTQYTIFILQFNFGFLSALSLWSEPTEGSPTAAARQKYCFFLCSVVRRSAPADP
jgi:hypothetical protein